MGWLTKKKSAPATQAEDEDASEKVVVDLPDGRLRVKFQDEQDGTISVLEVRAVVSCDSVRTSLVIAWHRCRR
jgi:hypothetical protein